MSTSKLELKLINKKITEVCNKLNCLKDLANLSREQLRQSPAEVSISNEEFYYDEFLNVSLVF